VGEPGDLLGLARPRRVLDEVVVPRAVHARMGLAPDHHVPLMEAREDGRRSLHVHELLDELEPAVAVPDLAPHVGGGVTIARSRIPLATRIAGAAGPLVERQEDGLGAGEPRGHVRELRVQGEVHEGTAGEERELRVPTRAVLLDRVLDGLSRPAVLELRGRGRDAVDEEHEVNRIAGPGVEADLPNDAEAVRRVGGRGGPVDRVGRPELTEREGDAALGEPAPEDMDGAVLVELLGEALEQARAGRGLAAGQSDEPVPLLGLRVLDECDDVLRIEAEVRVVAPRIAFLPATIAGQL